MRYKNRGWGRRGGQEEKEETGNEVKEETEARSRNTAICCCLAPRSCVIEEHPPSTRPRSFLMLDLNQDWPWTFEIKPKGFTTCINLTNSWTHRQWTLYDPTSPYWLASACPLMWKPNFMKLFSCLLCSTAAFSSHKDLHEVHRGLPPPKSK